MFELLLYAGTRAAYQEYHEALEAMNAAVVEYVRGMPVVKVFGTALDSFQRLTESVLSHRDRSRKMSQDYSKAYPLFLTAASSSLVFLVPAVILLLRRSETHASLIPTALFFMIIGGGWKTSETLRCLSD